MIGVMFEDILAANERYRSNHHDPGLSGRAARGLGVLTCIDSRIDPLAALGLRTGDAKILRNAGARVTPDALRSLILATNLLGVTRVCVIQHTDCAVMGSSEEEIRARIVAAHGIDPGDWEFLADRDQLATLQRDLQVLRDCPLLPRAVELGGFILDVRSGALTSVDQT